MGISTLPTQSGPTKILRRMPVRSQVTLSPPVAFLLALESFSSFLIVSHCCFWRRFFACVLARCVAVPAAPPSDSTHLHRNLARLTAIVTDCAPKAILTSTTLKAALTASAIVGGKPRPLVVVAVDEVMSSASPSNSSTGALAAAEKGYCDVDPEELVMLQYTSGSTGTPKGVLLNHRCILHNQRAISSAFQTTPLTSSVVSWLPLFHDMGLLGAALHPVYLGTSCTFLPTYAFLRRPLRWLQVISRFQAEVSGGPPFGFGLCLRKISESELKKLCLSCWKVAFVGSEAIPFRLMQAFQSKLTSLSQLPANAVLPVYGLAECTLLVTSPLARGGSSDLRAQAIATPTTAAVAAAEGVYVSCGNGQNCAGMDVRVVNPETCQPCGEGTGEVGEVWIRAGAGEGSVALGYWNRQGDESFQGFLHRPDHQMGEAEGPFLRTGDLGFFAKQQGHLYPDLFICGRRKDLIIVAGKNYYPADIERTVEQAAPPSLVRPGCCAAFAVSPAHLTNQTVSTSAEEQQGSSGGGDALVIVAEANTTATESVPKFTLQELKELICQRVLTEHGIKVSEVVLVKAGEVQKTTSGKISRSANQKRFLQNSFATL